MEEERERNTKLTDVLDSVETTLERYRQQGRRLEGYKGQALIELQQLKIALDRTRSGPPRLIWRVFDPRSFAERAGLIDRLDAVIAVMEHDGEESARPNSANKLALAFRRRGTGKAIAYSTVAGSALAAAFVAFIVHGNAENDPIVDGLIRAQAGTGLVETSDGRSGGQPTRIETSTEATVKRPAAGTAASGPASPLEVELQGGTPTSLNGSEVAIADTIAPIAAPYSAAKEVALLLAHAEDQIADLALTTPRGDNAYETYQIVLSLQPDNRDALAGFERIALKYVELTDRAVAKGDLIMADRYVGKAKELAPGHPSVRALVVPTKSARRPSEDESRHSAIPNGTAESQQTPSEFEASTEDGAASNALSSLAYRKSSAGGSGESITTSVEELMATLEPVPVKAGGVDQDLDTEMIEMLPLVVPVYPSKLFAPYKEPAQRSDGRDVAGRSGGNSAGGAASGGSGSGGSASGGSGAGASGGGESGGGGSAGGESGGGGSSGGGSAGDGSSGGGSAGGGSAGGGQGKGKGGGQGKGGGNGTGGGNGKGGKK